MSNRSFSAENSFARKHLEKHGWTEGSGLGAREHGISEAIKVKIKKDNTGVGHDPAKEFTDHWWNAVFNKAAASIIVETGEDGIVVKTKEKKKKERTADARKTLYSNFIKGSLLNNGTETMVEKQDNNDSSDEEHLNNTTLPDAELFRICGGLTAHKAARHGLKLNGKLARVQEQDKLLLEKIKHRQRPDATAKAAEGGGLGLDRVAGGDLETEQSPKKHRKKKKKRERSESDTSDATLGCELAAANGRQAGATSLDGILASDGDHTMKKKKRKRKSEDLGDAGRSCEIDGAQREDDRNSTSSKADRKEKKKKKGEKSKELDDGLEQDDINSTLNCRSALEETCSIADNETVHKKKKKRQEKKGDQISSGTEAVTSPVFGTEALVVGDQGTTKGKRVDGDVCTDDAAASKNSSVVVISCVTSGNKQKRKKNREKK